MNLCVGRSFASDFVDLRSGLPSLSVLQFADSLHQCRIYPSHQHGVNRRQGKPYLPSPTMTRTRIRRRAVSSPLEERKKVSENARWFMPGFVFLEKADQCVLTDCRFFFFAGKGKAPLEISLPQSFEHTVHVGFNPDTGEFSVGFNHSAYFAHSCQITIIFHLRKLLFANCDTLRSECDEDVDISCTLRMCGSLSTRSSQSHSGRTYEVMVNVAQHSPPFLFEF